MILRKGGPDVLTEELVSALSGNAIFEFKPLFTVVYGSLLARNAAYGGEEMLRLRLYEKLQWLVTTGGVKKEGKHYRGNPTTLRPLIDQIATRHCQKLLEAAAEATPDVGLEEGTVG